MGREGPAPDVLTTSAEASASFALGSGAAYTDRAVAEPRPQAPVFLVQTHRGECTCRTLALAALSSQGGIVPRKAVGARQPSGWARGGLAESPRGPAALSAPPSPGPGRRPPWEGLWAGAKGFRGRPGSQSWRGAAPTPQHGRPSEGVVWPGAFSGAGRGCPVVTSRSRSRPKLKTRASPGHVDGRGIPVGGPPTAVPSCGDTRHVPVPLQGCPRSRAAPSRPGWGLPATPLTGASV